METKIIDQVPNSGHIIDNEAAIKKTDSHFNPVVNIKLTEAQANSPPHNLFSIGEPTSKRFKPSKQSSSRCWDSEPRTNNPIKQLKDNSSNKEMKTPKPKSKVQHKSKSNKEKVNSVHTKTKIQESKTAVLDLKHIIKTMGRVMKDNRLWAVLFIIIAQFLIANGTSVGDAYKQQQSVTYNTKPGSNWDDSYNRIVKTARNKRFLALGNTLTYRQISA